MQQSTNNIQYSIIIIVRNDRGILTTLTALDSIVAEDLSVEVIVVDASLPGALRDIRKQYSWVQWHDFKNTTGKRFTIPEQRNAGIKYASGSVIIFLDSDCQPSQTWLSTIITAFEAEQHDAITGPIRSIGARTTHDAGYERYVDGQSVVESGAANLAVQAVILKELRGFDEHMSYGEDVDLTWRLRSAGYRLVFKEGMAIGFNWGSNRLEWKRAFRYGTARVTLYKKHLANWRNLFNQDINVLIYPLFIVLLPITWWIPVYPFLLLVPLLRNRNNRPVRTTLLHLTYATGAIKGLFKSVG